MNARQRRTLKRASPEEGDVVSFTDWRGVRHHGVVQWNKFCIPHTRQVRTSNGAAYLVTLNDLRRG